MRFVDSKLNYKAWDYHWGDSNMCIATQRYFHLYKLAYLSDSEMKLSFRDIETNKWTKWLSFFKYKVGELQNAYDIHRSLLRNEIVIESDYPTYEENYDATRLIGAILEGKGFQPMYYYSGNKSIHCIPSNERVVVSVNGKIRLTKIGYIHTLLQRGNQQVFIKSPNGFVKVLDSKKREQNINEKLVRLSLNSGLSLFSSKDHLFPILRDNKRIIVSQAKDITAKDKLIISLKKYIGSDSGTYELGRFLGLFLAEGCSYERGHILNFTFSRNEFHLIKFIKEYSLNLGAYVFVHKRDTYTKVNVFSHALYSLTKEFLIGNLARNKGFKSKVYGMNIRFREGLIDGWLEGDGLHEQYQDGVTASVGLAKSIQRLGFTIGRYFSIKRRNKEGRSYYILRWIKKPKMNYIKGRAKSDRNGNYYSINPPKDCVFIKIKQTNKNYSKKTDLIDLEVDSKDHLFCLANGIVTHNCHVYFDFRCFLKLDKPTQDKILEKFSSKKRFITSFMKWLREKMISCWGLELRKFDTDLVNQTHLIRSEMSRNKLGYKTFVGYSTKM